MGNNREMQNLRIAIYKTTLALTEIRMDQLIQALGEVTGAGSEKLRDLLDKRIQDNAGDPFAALVDFLDDCKKIKKHGRRICRCTTKRPSPR